MTTTTRRRTQKKKSGGGGGGGLPKEGRKRKLPHENQSFFPPP